MIYHNPTFHRPDARGARQRRGKAVPVTFVPEDQLVTLAALEGGWGFRKRLTALGLLPGESLRVVRNSGGGPVVLEVKDVRLAIGRGEARGIMVRGEGRDISRD